MTMDYQANINHHATLTAVSPFRDRCGPDAADQQRGKGKPLATRVVPIRSCLPTELSLKAKAGDFDHLKPRFIIRK